MSRNQRKSSVWKHFTKVSSTKVRCKNCLIELKYCNNTTNLWAHAASRHHIKKDIESVNVRTVSILQVYITIFNIK